MGAKNYANTLQILILKYSCRPEKLPGLLRNRPQIPYLRVLVMYHSLVCHVSYHENMRR